MSVDESARREGMIKITELAKQARELLKQAEQIADETGNSFDFELSGRNLTYEPNNFQSSNCFSDGTPGSWNSSSDYC